MVSVARGVYRQDEPLTVAGIVRSLQRTGSDLVVGGQSAMRLHGILETKPSKLFAKISLSGYDRPPSWLSQWDDGLRFDHLRIGRLFKLERPEAGPPLGKRTHFLSEFGWMGVTFWISSVARALFEILSEVPDRVSFEDANDLMKKVAFASTELTLRPVLDQSVSIKVNRLFLWFAERLGYQWVERLNIERYIGSGKRQIAKNGRYVKKYCMTVPRGFPASQQPTGRVI